MSTYSTARCAAGMIAAACYGAVLAASAPAAEAARTSKLQVTQGGTVVTIRRGADTVLEYQSAASPMKPYVRQLFTPAGVQVLRDSVKDHKHHHGLMFAVTAGGVNFWEEVKASGREVPQGDPKMRAATIDGVSRAGFTQSLDWLGPGDRKLLEERRTVAALSGPAIQATLLTWHSRLHAPAGETVALSGSHYFGLGVRFVESMDEAGRFFNSDGNEGVIVRGSERVTPARWCAYTSKVGDKAVTIAIFDHPSNLRRAHFFTMRPFAYLSATLNLWKEPMELAPGSDLDLRYGVALWDGEIRPDQVEKLYGQWKQLEP